MQVTWGAIAHASSIIYAQLVYTNNQLNCPDISLNWSDIGIKCIQLDRLIFQILHEVYTLVQDLMIWVKDSSFKHQ